MCFKVENVHVGASVVPVGTCFLAPVLGAGQNFPDPSYMCGMVACYSNMNSNQTRSSTHFLSPTEKSGTV